ncbi:MAG: glycoside hydrolase family 27 protein, partial [Kiritimatiellales bacterium]|nr:glycoside hydrolase family 27 protein [Kiritimatiellales bacterium]
GLASAPPLGWNSFDSYGCNIYEERALVEADAFIEKFAPHGYEYFVIDNGWFSKPQSVMKDGLLLAVTQHADPKDVVVNEYGIVQPSELFFPNGFKPLADKLHAKGLKFGLHLMRGIPRVAVERDLPIKGTPYTAKDIYTTKGDCGWCKYMHGIDTTKPGAQEFYNSVINEMASWGVDFIKVDHVTHKPADIEAYAKAIAQCGRPIVLSLSAGGTSNVKYLDSYRKANMVRTTPDIWDRQDSLDHSFDSMRKWQGLEQSGAWPDLDMIPFGELCILNRRSVKQKKPGKSEAQFAGYLHHWCFFTEPQKETFITQRAIAASPIIIGGSMINMDEHSMKLLTSPEMLACVRNGVHGKLLHAEGAIEAWNTPLMNDAEYGFISYDYQNEGWLALFNRSEEEQSVALSGKFAGIFSSKDYTLHDIWKNKTIEFSKKGPPVSFEIEANGVVFLKYKER